MTCFEFSFDGVFQTMLHDNTDRGHKDPNAVSRIQRGASEDGGGEGGGGVSSQDLGGGSNKNRAYAVIITGAALVNTLSTSRDFIFMEIFN